MSISRSVAFLWMRAEKFLWSDANNHWQPPLSQSQASCYTDVRCRHLHSRIPQLYQAWRIEQDDQDAARVPGQWFLMPIQNSADTQASKGHV